MCQIMPLGEVALGLPSTFLAYTFKLTENSVLGGESGFPTLRCFVDFKEAVL